MSHSWDPQAFAALKCHNYRLFLIGQSISLTGFWMKRLTMAWLVYRLTLSGFSLGIIELLSTAPLIVLGFFAGTWLDSHDLRKTFITTQVLSLVQVLILAFLSYTNTIDFTIVALLALLIGLIHAVDLPCRQSSVALMIENVTYLKSAIALYSIAFNASRLIGPSIAGFIIYRWGEATCFFLCAIAYLPIIYLLIFSIKFRERASKLKNTSLLAGMREGLHYVSSVLIFRKTFLLLMPFAFFSGSQIALFPLFAAETLGGNAKLLGMLYGSVGLGAILAGLFLTIFIGLHEIPKKLIFSVSLTSVCFVLFANSTSIALSLFVAFFLGFALIGTFISTNTLMQSITPDDKRGRIMSLYTLGPSGLAPLGALFAGGLADYIGAPLTMTLCGVAMIFVLMPYLPSINASTEQIQTLLKNRS